MALTMQTLSDGNCQQVERATETGVHESYQTRQWRDTYAKPSPNVPIRANFLYMDSCRPYMYGIGSNKTARSVMMLKTPVTIHMVFVSPQVPPGMLASQL